MSQRLDSASRDILQFRPKINYVEPDVELGDINPVPAGRDPADAVDMFNKTRSLARSVNLLATALQAKADVQAQGVDIALDPAVDGATVAALRRTYPEADSTKITYEQYRKCKDNQLKKSLDIANKGLVKQEEIDKATRNLTGTITSTDGDAGGIALFGTEMAANGGLRPELQKNQQIIEPIDLEEMQDILLRLLTNFIWKKFIKPAMPGIVKRAVPDKLVKVPGGHSTEGFLKIGTDVVDAGQKAFDRLPSAANQTANQAADLGTLTSETEAAAQEEADRTASNLSAATGEDINVVNAGAARTDLTSTLDPINANPLGVQDCHTITRTYERGAAYAATEASVFAQLAPMLHNIRAQAQAYEEQAANNEVFFKEAAWANNSTDAEDAASDFLIGTTDEERDKENEKLKWLKECLPCDFRLDIETAASFGVQIFTDLWEAVVNHFDYFQQMLGQLQQIAALFDSNARRRDLCAIIAFFSQSICLLDIRRVIAILMALLAQVSFEMTNVFDMIFTIVAPLVMPFFSNIVDTIEKFLLAIVRPALCTIDRLIALIQRWDYSELFQNNANLNFNIDLTRKANLNGSVPFEFRPNAAAQGYWVNPLTADKSQGTAFQHPPVTGELDTSSLETGFGATARASNFLFGGAEADLNPFDQGEYPGSEEERAAVEAAERDLAKIRQKRSEVDFDDPSERQAYLKELEGARENRRNAAVKQQTSHNQRFQQAFQAARQSATETVARIVDFVRRAIASVEAWANELMEEFRNMMSSFLGNSDGAFTRLNTKLEILKIIAMLKAIVETISKKPDCEAEDDVPNRDGLSEGERWIDYILPPDSRMKIYTDDDGTVHIEEDDKELEDALNEVVKSDGTGDTPSQRLKALVEFTGDPVVDAVITDTTNAITTPARDAFKCPFNTSAAEVEQVNQWVRELSAR